MEPAEQLEALPEPGELIASRFLIESWAATGGMGSVFRARDTVAGGAVAVKVSSRRHASFDPRFARESLMLADLSHPALVRYVAHGSTASGAPFLAMEWLDGEDLERTLSRGPLSASQSIALLRRLCTGLAVAHERGVVHRDLKPSNIFVVGGEVEAAKVLDFGVARVRDGSRRTLTQAGKVLGTVGYMAPEQAMGLADVDARADIFSLGCVLFECLTGRGAFYSEHDIAVLAKVLRDEPPRISQLRPEVGDFADAVTACMLAKDPARRPGSARELLRMLEGLSVCSGEPAFARAEPAVSMTSPERKVVSVVLARTRRSAQTLTSERVGQQSDEFEVLAHHFQAETIPLYATGLLATISDQGAATDRASHAALFALALQELRPELSVAVATGLLGMQGVVPIGQAIDRAAALLEENEAATRVRICDLTRGLLAGRFEVQSAGTGSVLVGGRQDLEEPRLLMGRRTSCVGRDKELALLHATLAETIDDSVARVVLITAAPGFGKSRLASAFLEGVQQGTTTRVLLARADQTAVGSALGLLQRLLSFAAGLGNITDGRLRHLVLSEYLSSLRAGDGPETEFLSELLGGSPQPARSVLFRAARSDPGLMAAQFFCAFSAWIGAELARGPLLLLLEDFHWADSASLGYLEEVLRQYRDRPLCVVALGRPEMKERFPHSPLPGVHEIRLEGLTRRAAERLVRGVLTASDEVVLDLVARADGNPFYLEELARCVAEGSPELPGTVVAMVQSRLERLEPPAQRVLWAASVFGGSSWSGGVVELLGADRTATEWLETLAEREILARRPVSKFIDNREYEFRHALLRDAAYAMLTNEERRRAHARAGLWLERAGEGNALVLADHLELGGLAARAAHWLLPAAIAAMEAGDFSSSMALSKRALVLGVSGEQRGMLLLLEGWIAVHLSEPSNHKLEEAIALLPRASAHWWLGLSALLFGALSQRSDLLMGYIQLAVSTPPGEAPIGAYGSALQVMSAALLLLGQADLAWSVIDRFENVTQDDSQIDPMFAAWLDVSRCQLAASSPYRGSWQLERALFWGRAARDAMDRLGSPHRQSTALLCHGYASRTLGLYAEADASLTASIAKATQVGNLLIAHYATLLLTLVKLQRGETRLACELLKSLKAARDPSVIHGTQVMKAETCFRSGQFLPALAGLNGALTGPSLRYRMVASCTLARTQLALGHHAEACRAVDEALNGDVLWTPDHRLDLLATKAEALYALGEHASAEATACAATYLLDEVSLAISEPVLRDTFLTNVESCVRVRALR